MKDTAMKTLYKKDTKDKIRQWSISTGKDGSGHYYEISFGEVDGAIQSSRTHVTSGKNIGRANATTAEEQCLAEAEALYKKQMDRKGYSEDVPDTAPLKPMLAKSFKDECHKIEYPAIVQAKLDGCVHGSTFLTTKSHGRLTIKEIVDNKLKVKVKSYNLKNKKIEYKAAVSYFKNKENSKDSQWYEIEMESGEILKVTGCHKIFIPKLKCWRRVDELNGDEEFLLE